MRCEKFEGKYIPKFESEELKYGNIFTKACMNYSICSCECSGLKCDNCILDSRDHCIEYLKQHHKHLQNYIDSLMESLKQEKGEKTMENDFPKLRPGMAITFTNNNKLGFMISETQIMYVYPNNNYSAIINGWDFLGDREDVDVPYSKIKAIYATSDTDNETGEVIESFTPWRLARMAEAISNDKNLATLTGVKRMWRRRVRKEMTVEEIEKELGYKIKIVGEDK